MNNFKTVIITGAAGGIGSATAARFAAAGYWIVLCDVDRENLARLARKLENEYGAETLLLPGDLADQAYLESIVSETAGKWGRIDVLVNNAAWRTLESLRTMRMEDWEHTLKVCLTAPAFLTKWAAQRMEEKQTGGVIVNITSVMAGRASGTGSAYIAAKGALEALIRETAVTYGRSGIRVVGVAPGLVDTDISRDYTDHQGTNISDRLILEMTDSVPLGRGASVEEIAEAIFWLSSDAAGYITGTTLLVDGGFGPNFSRYSIKKQQFPDEF